MFNIKICASHEKTIRTKKLDKVYNSIGPPYIRLTNF